MASILFPSFKTDSLTALQVEVTLYPWRIEEKRVHVSIKKDEKEVRPLSPPETEVKQHPVSEAPSLPPEETEIRENPVTEAAPVPVQEEQDYEKERGEQAEKKPIVLASLNPESVITLERKGSSEPLRSPPQNPSVEEETRQAAKSPFLLEKEAILVHPRYVENPKPLYPREARKRGAQGEVLLKVEVLSTGLVGQVEVKKSSGHEILDRSALSAVKQWRFSPAKRGEEAIAFWVNIPIKFQLQ